MLIEIVPRIAMKEAMSIVDNEIGWMPTKVGPWQGSTGWSVPDGFWENMFSQNGESIVVTADFGGVHTDAVTAAFRLWTHILTMTSGKVSCFDGVGALEPRVSALKDYFDAQ